ncbi:hypothetical protein ACFL4C_01800 [Candidatus Omnitrophota bacterium]
MMRKLFLIFVFMVSALLISQISVQAGKGAGYKHADRNKDGVVDKKEWKTEKKVEHKQRREVSWRHSRAKVNTPLEAKYDSDGDGWLQPDEAKELMQAKYSLVKTHGKAKVDSALEEEYDENNDGVIDLDEAEELKADLE